MSKMILDGFTKNKQGNDLFLPHAKRCYQTESFKKQVLKRGTSNASRALIEYDRFRFFAKQLVRVLGNLPL